MRVLISTDLEGISGVCVWDQTRERGLLYEEARRLLMGDISATVEGCLAGGVDLVYVVDGHGGGFNIVPELMHPKAQYITGTDRPSIRQSAALFEAVDACILLGYHAMAGTPSAILRHTQSSRRGDRYWYNGRECGEIAQSGLLMGHFGIPVVMVTGDDATCREAIDLLGTEIVTVAVKRAYGVQFGLLLSPEAAHDAIREGAMEAMTRIGQCSPLVMELPIRGRLQFPDKQTADAFQPRVSERLDDVTFEATFADALEVYRF